MLRRRWYEDTRAIDNNRGICADGKTVGRTHHAIHVGKGALLACGSRTSPENWQFRTRFRIGAVGVRTVFAFRLFQRKRACCKAMAGGVYFSIVGILQFTLPKETKRCAHEEDAIGFARGNDHGVVGLYGMHSGDGAGRGVFERRLVRCLVECCFECGGIEQRRELLKRGLILGGIRVDCVPFGVISFDGIICGIAGNPADRHGRPEHARRAWNRHGRRGRCRSAGH